jgi:uncharacterized protein (DUF433 family)
MAALPEFVPSRQGGRPTMGGTRVSVDNVLETLASGQSIEETAGNHRILKETVYLGPEIRAGS